MIRIVDTRPEHLDDILLMEQQCFSVPWTRDQLAAQMSDSMYIFLAAEDESGRAVGYVGLMYVLDEGYISNVAVSPSRRREGIADMLLTELYARAKAKKLSFLTLEVRESNLAARRLYEKNGFETVGKRKNYYEKPTEDAILMSKFFQQEAE